MLGDAKNNCNVEQAKEDQECGREGQLTTLNKAIKVGYIHSCVSVAYIYLGMSSDKA